MPESDPHEPAADLDPHDWEAFRAHAHAALDAAIDHVRTVRSRPVWTPVPESLTDRLAATDPATGVGRDAAVAEFERLVVPHPTGNVHPRFFGWVHGGGTADGIVAAMWEAAMNCNLGGRDHGAVHVERQVIDWFRGVMGFSPESSGLLVSGTSTGTVIAFAAAREARRRDAVVAGQLGADHIDVPRPAVYASEVAHGCVAKALATLGHPAGTLRTMPVDALDRLDLDATEAAITRDRAQGRTPAVLCVTAGTVTTGAIDDLEAAADLARRAGLWLHVDGAFGALGRLAPSLQSDLAGIARADSVAFDVHKWMQVTFACGGVLVRDAAAHHAAFSPGGTYPSTPGGLGGGRPWFAEYGIELSRPFRALPVWLAIRTHGLEAFGAMIDERCRLARHLADIVRSHPRLELIVEPRTHIVCMRHVPDGPALDPQAADDHVDHIVVTLQESGVAAPSTARHHGRLVIRASIANHRTTESDVEILADSIVRIGDEHAASHPAEIG